MLDGSEMNRSAMGRKTQAFGQFFRGSGAVFALILCSGLCAALLMLWITDLGPGVSPDSVTYIETARSLLAGDGFQVEDRPMTHYPPVYPLLLSVAGWFNGGDILQGGRWLAVAFFGINAALLGVAVQLVTRNSLSSAACAMALFLFSAPVIIVHSAALSEAPFIAFTVTAFVLLSLHIRQPNPYLLLFAALAAGMAIATRYAGLSLLPPVVFALLLFGDRPLKPKIKDTFIAVGVACLPLVFWLLRNLTAAQTATNRSFAIHPFDIDHARALVNVVHDFAFPLTTYEGMKAYNIGIFTVFFLAGLLVLYKKNYLAPHARSGRLALPGLCLLFALTYILLIVISISFFDAHTPIDFRILLPFLLALVVATVSLVWSLSHVLDKKMVWYGFLGLVLVSVVMKGDNAVSEATRIRHSGLGYTAEIWQKSEIINFVHRVGDDLKIYSNGPDVIRILAKKNTLMLPRKIRPGTRGLNPEFEDQMSRLYAECRQGKALVAYFYGINWRWYLPSIEELESRGQLSILRKFADGVIYTGH